MNKKENIEMQNNDYNKSVDNRTLNSMILYLRINRVAEFQNVDHGQTARFYDYISAKKYTRDDIITLAYKHKWTKEWQT